jgi:serpin B
MGKVLRGDATVHEALAALAREYGGKDGMPALANAVWVQQGAPLLPAYVDLVAKHYGAPPEPIDFNEADAAARRINDWVSGRTRERIKGIVSPDMFNANTTLVLANALHFKAAWRNAFEPRITKERPFTLASGEKVDVPFMAQTEHVGYAEKDGAVAVELPYEGGRFSMVVILPAEGAPAAIPDGLLGALKVANVSVFLPRFRIESGFNLKETLAAMGMTAAFTGDADFSGIDGTRNLFISVVAHKAFIAVDEAGTEAAAATAIVMELKGEPGAPKVFRADRPFLFLIRDRKSGTILFLGRVADPRA